MPESAQLQINKNMEDIASNAIKELESSALNT